MAFFGGLPEKEDLEKIAAGQPHIAIGTPGRLKALCEAKDPKTQKPREVFLDLSGIKRFVMDECDALLKEIDMRRDVQIILMKTPKEKQVMMFSATLDSAIRPTCKKFTKEALEVFIDDDSKLTLHGLQQYSVDLQEKQKNRRLTQLLDDLEFNQVIIFVKDVKRCKELSQLLRDNNFPTIAVHGGIKDQKERLDMYNQFKEYKARIMVSTDLFGRGVDFEHVNIVVNYDMPKDPEQYLHRVGRSARFGTKGLAISFVAGTEDTDMMNKVREKFNMEVPALPATIDPSSYMGTS
jgi:ATP-dependent RNA helicase UAP56/SUB2